jgi:hypothetical protein
VAPVEIDFLSNERDVVRGAEKMADTFEQVGDSLDDVARDGERSTERLEASFRDLSNTVQRESRSIGTDIGDNSRRGFGRAREAVREFKGEVVQNLGEVASSFDGSVEGIADGFQGLAGGASVGLIAMGGPIAAVGAALAAVGFIGGAMFTQLAEDTEKNKQAVANWAGAYIAAGGTILSASQLAAEAQAIATDPDRYAAAKQNAEDWGVTVATAMRAMAGDATALTVVQGNLNDRTEEAARLLAVQEEQVDANAAAAYDLDDATRRGADSLGALHDAMSAGEAIARDTSDALLEIVASASEATLEVDALGNQLYTLPDGTKIVVHADTGLASQSVETFKGDLDGIPERVDSTVLATVLADTSALERTLAKSRTVRVNLEGYARSGHRVI